MNKDMMPDEEGEGRERGRREKEMERGDRETKGSVGYITYIE